MANVVLTVATLAGNPFIYGSVLAIAAISLLFKKLLPGIRRGTGLK